MIIKNKYDNFIFDFDGVIFDTNLIKKKAIYESTKKYLNTDDLNKFVNFFLNNSGIPREKKISKFFDITTSKKIQNKYSEILYRNLLSANKIPGIINLLNKISKLNKKIHILSGGNIDEILMILKNNKMLKYFDKILAGPDDKQHNLNKLNLTNNTIFFGDSYHDYEIALQNDLDFVFVYGFSIQEDWKESIDQNKCLSIVKNFYKLY